MTTTFWIKQCSCGVCTGEIPRLTRYGLQVGRKYRALWQEKPTQGYGRLGVCGKEPLPSLRPVVRSSGTVSRAALRANCSTPYALRGMPVVGAKT